MVTRLQGYGYSPSLYVFSSHIGSMKIGVCIHVSVYTVEIAVKLSNFAGAVH